MVSFDTGALMAVFDADHPRHDWAREAFRDADQVLLHPCVLAETSTLLRRRINGVGKDGNKGARDAIRLLRAEPRCRLIAGIDHDAVTRRYLADHQLSFVDAVVLELAFRERTAPVTFDKAIAAHWKKRASRRKGKPHPDEVASWSEPGFTSLWSNEADKVWDEL